MVMKKGPGAILLVINDGIIVISVSARNGQNYYFNDLHLLIFFQWKSTLKSATIHVSKATAKHTMEWYQRLYQGILVNDGIQDIHMHQKSHQTRQEGISILSDHNFWWYIFAKFLKDHNYCRNPDGDDNGPWCYTTNSKVRWEYCKQIPRCSSSNPGCGPKPIPTQPTISRTTRPRTEWQPTTRKTTPTPTTTTLPSKQCGKNANDLELGARQYKLTKMDSEGKQLFSLYPIIYDPYFNHII